MLNENKAPEPTFVGKGDYTLFDWTCPYRWELVVTGSNSSEKGYKLYCDRFIKNGDGTDTRFSVGSE